jgi:arylsulfatase A-like enzyme
LARFRDLARTLGARPALWPALLAAVSCAPKPPAGPARRVILVTCDTLRADHLGCYGYPRPTSPNVDRFAADATLYEEAYSCAPMTVPALASLHTGLLPDETGTSAGNRCLLPAELDTLAEELSRAGVLTAAIVSNWVLRRPSDKALTAGFQQGFASFDDRMEVREVNRGLYERRAQDTADAAIAWLSSRRFHAETPFFLWVHFQDPHGPYTPPDRFEKMFRTDVGDEPELPIGKSQSGKGQIPAYQRLGDERRPAVFRDRYDGEIAAFDEAFGRLIAWLSESGLYEDSLVILTADHGESLGEHGYWFCHGENVYREEVRVPLVLRAPRGLAPRGARIGAVAGHLDLWPTILEALGVEAPPRRGVSILRVAPPPERLLVHTLRAAGAEGRWIGAGDGRHSLVVPGAGPPQLYDLGRDPGEEIDRSAEEPDVLSSMLDRLRAELSGRAGPAGPGAVWRTDADSARALHALGYAEGDERR